MAALIGRFAPPDVDEACVLLEKTAMPAKLTGYELLLGVRRVNFSDMTKS